MSLRIYWQFYRDIFPFVACFTVIVMIGSGLLWGFVLFNTIALLIGILGFRHFKKEEYYFYHNKGITLWKLFKASFIINLILGLPIFSSVLLIYYIIVGGFTTT